MKYIVIHDGAIRVEQGDLALEDIQRLVGGSVEHVTLRVNTDNSVISLYCNEEGKLEGLRPNFFIPKLDDIIVGDAIVCGTDPDGATRDLTDGEIYTVNMAKSGRYDWLPQLNLGIPA